MQDLNMAEVQFAPMYGLDDRLFSCPSARISQRWAALTETLLTCLLSSALPGEARAHAHCSDF